jgi:hypothetical protein
MASIVSIPVPEEHVMAVYRFLGTLTEDITRTTDGQAPAEEAEWNEGLVREAMTGGDSLRLRRALVMVAESGDSGMTTDELGKELEYERGASAVAGMLGAAQRRWRNKLGMTTPLWKKQWEPFEPGPGGTSRLTMTPTMREWVLSVG